MMGATHAVQLTLLKVCTGAAPRAPEEYSELLTRYARASGTAAAALEIISGKNIFVIWG